MTTIQPPITNPELKLPPPKPGVVAPPPVYAYSINEELRLRDSNKQELFRSVWEQDKARQSQQKNQAKINTAIKAAKCALGALGAFALFRYRRSIPLVKKLFKNPPKKAVPSFCNDMSSIWHYIMKR